MASRNLHLPLLVLVIGLFLLPIPHPAEAQGSSSAELIDAVNALRASQGLTPLQPNSILMGTAQAQANYMASIGQVTHTGPGGTSPKDRAIAAGYGGGATIFISENIQEGMNLSAAQAVQNWTGDAPHWNTMMGASYRDIGAGVATAGSAVYYVIDVGYVAGSAPASTTGSNAAAGAPLPTAIPLAPLVTATPNSDGSLVHVVGYGQTLVTIALAYGVKVDDIRQLNGLPAASTLIYPGQKLIIRKASPATATATITDTPLPATATPTATRRPRTPTPTPTRTLTPTATRPPLIPGMDDPVVQRRALGITLVVVCTVGLVVVGVSSVRSRA